MKKAFLILIMAICSLSVKSQLCFLQENFRGGVSGDGVSYNNMEYLQADTIQLQTDIPLTAIIKKAYLFANRGVYQAGLKPKKDNSVTLKFNNNPIIIDSSNIVTNKFNFDNSNPSGENWITAVDITAYIHAASNILITPCQGCQMLADTSRHYVLINYFLVVLYEDNSMPLTNFAIYLNDKTFSTSFQYLFNNLNPINNNLDVSFSIWSTDTDSHPFDYSSNYVLNSSLGNFNLGTLDMYKGNTVWSEKLPGSFDYKNNSLIGLQDDTPDAFIDSTDALANIKTYLPFNATTFSVTTSGNVIGAGSNIRSGFFLAYTTPCPASITKDTSITICKGQNVQLSASTGFTNYNWYPLAGLTDSTIASPIATPQHSTNYIAYVKDAAGCMHTEHTQIIVHGAPEPDTIVTINAVCGSQLGTLSITPNYHNYGYNYNIGNGTTTDTSITNVLPGTYTLTTTDDAGCTYQNVFSISEVNPVTANFSIQTATSNYIAPLYVSFSNNTTGATNYNWYFPTSTTNTYNTNYTFTDAGTYTVTLIAYSNLQKCADTVSKIITVLAQDTAGIFIPNVFSPNGDGINDVFEVKLKNAELELFEIYDRWGVVIIKNEELKINSNGLISWSGRATSGIECSAGTYFYVIKIKLDSAYSKEGTKEFKGFITLVR